MDVFINGIKYDVERDLEFTEQVGNKSDSLISIVVDEQPFPVAGDIIEIKDEGETLFWGTCGIPKSPKYSTGFEKKVYTIVCQNANSILSNRIINEAFQNTTLSEIISVFFEKYISAEGIQLGFISQIDVTFEAYTAKDYNLQVALNELADVVSATWNIGSDHKFYFLKTEDFPLFPQTINLDFLLGTEYQQSTKTYKTRTVQYVSGATDITSEQQETFTFNGEQTSFILSFPLAQRPTIYVNGNKVPNSIIGINGIDDSDPTIIFTFSYNSATVGYKSTSYLTQNDTVKFVYAGMYPIRIGAYNNEKISEIHDLTGTSGLRERVYLATDITSTADALQLANSLLTQFSEVTGEVKMWLLSSQLYAVGMSLSDTNVLTQFNFDLPSIGITGNYIVSERTLIPFFADMSNAKEKFKIILVLKNRDYLKSYGETLSSLYRSVNQLTIRADDVVISQSSVAETDAVSEAVGVGQSLGHYATSSIINGSLFAPFDFDGIYYPVGTNEPYSGNAGTGVSFYPTESISYSSAFSPPDFGTDVYPA